MMNAYIFMCVLASANGPVDNNIDPELVAALAAGNAAFGCVVGSVGAVIDGGSWGDVGSRCLRGAGGGLISFANEWGAASIPTFSFFFKLGSDLGNSAVANVFAGRGMFDRYMTQVGPVLMEIDKDKGFDWRISINYASNLIFYSLTESVEFDPVHSLMLLEPVFKTNKAIEINGSDSFVGYSVPGMIVYHENAKEPLRTLAHENNHALQYRKFHWGNKVSDDFVDWLGLDFLKRFTLGADLFRSAYLYLDMTAPYMEQVLEITAYGLTDHLSRDEFGAGN